jgi:quercetin 2,3-dioxygenase
LYNLTICLYSITKATKDVNMCGSELHSLRSIKAAIPTPYHAFDNHSGAFMLRTEPADIPVVPVDGGSVRVVAGQFDGQSSPISHDARWLTQVNILDVTLQAGATLNIPVAAGDNAFFVIYSGSFDAPEHVDAAQAAIIFAANGAMAQLRAGSQNLRGVFFSGTPIDEPMFPKGPFMGNTAHDVAQYAARFQRGEMGMLSKSF